MQIKIISWTPPHVSLHIFLRSFLTYVLRTNPFLKLLGCLPIFYFCSCPVRKVCKQDRYVYFCRFPCPLFRKEIFSSSSAETATTLFPFLHENGRRFIDRTSSDRGDTLEHRTIALLSFFSERSNAPNNF